MAMAVTQIATATAALAWMFAEWIVKGKPSVLGIISGAVAGLVAITPASGFVDPRGALIMGIAARSSVIGAPPGSNMRSAMMTVLTSLACMASAAPSAPS
jgi:Amt family ammonium transporter